ncbi:ADP-ribosylglycohydrolase family protein [Fulvivirgaceae bacterium BMA12]|uniref:ADP-ribosylglycohydrolase family protein n=1 Tax=Agaribacillus aureus TaxID=3051825 RepID=A0ABT8L723_9BACT|nr:ADP-ribosylglycohydrolase family protein [Fulvivirgaceae bacterium BMA12]
MKILLGILALTTLLQGCSGPAGQETADNAITLPVPKRTPFNKNLDLDASTYRDKVLGALVGSAIGDAMGASTEMWNRVDIQREYGYITDLTPVNLSRQAEGPWGNLLDSGATTDDTRWKYFLGKYFAKHSSNLDVDHFAQMIVDYYQTEVRGLADPQLASSPDLLDNRIQRIDWMKEWARVALAYKKGGIEFERAKNRFYGGEMSCAGMLYTPMFGLIAPHADSAYRLGYDHALFDIGYAKDISGMVSAFTHLALQEDSIALVLQQGMLIDPFDYTDSRLVGRLLQNIVDESRGIVQEAWKIPAADTTKVVKLLQGYPGSKYEWLQQDYVYRELTKKQRAIAFHAGEIFQILYTALLFGQGDFEKTMAFMVNYGRDNDTVAAVAGMILGAQLGFKNLPDTLKEAVMHTNKEILGIDLETLANEVVAAADNKQP